MTLKETREWIEKRMGNDNNISIHRSKIHSHLISDLAQFFNITTEPFGFIKFEKRGR